MSTTAPPRDGATGSRPSPTRRRRWLERFESPLTTYSVLLGVTVVLVTFGLIMVLSSSTITSLNNSDNAFSIFLSQAVYAALGAVALWVASRQSVRTWKRLAFPLLIVALVLQVLVLFVGVEVNGNRNWLRFAGIGIQPSEVVKLALVLSGALVLQRKRDRLAELGHVILPYLFPIATLAIGLVLAGHDLGTVLVLMAIVAAVLFTAGVPGRWFLFAGAGLGAVAFTMVVTSPNRLARFDVWLGRDTDPYGAARQPLHGRYALADGGWFGLGLGGSREKWSWLSEPHNDFIFAIIGEELGLPGTLAVLLLFGTLALICYRLVLRSSDFFVRVATAGVMAWIVTQAMVNIGAVIGLLPVIGVPLPLVSSGGSSLITTMLGLGVLLSFARSEPGCAEALRGRPSWVRRSVAVLPGRIRSGGRRGGGS